MQIFWHFWNIRNNISQKNDKQLHLKDEKWYYTRYVFNLKQPHFNHIKTHTNLNNYIYKAFTMIGHYSKDWRKFITSVNRIVLASLKRHQTIKIMNFKNMCSDVIIAIKYFRGISCKKFGKMLHVKSYNFLYTVYLVQKNIWHLIYGKIKIARVNYSMLCFSFLLITIFDLRYVIFIYI